MLYSGEYMNTATGQILNKGFTILELSVVIIVIGVLATITLGLSADVKKSAEDQERSEDVASIVRRLEQAYTGQEIGGPGYPSTAEFLDDISTKLGTAKRIDPESLKAPGTTGSSSVVAATSSSTSAPISGGPSTTQYVYQPLTSSGSLCTSDPSINSAATTCVRFNIYYRNAKTNTVITVRSFHQQ